MSIMSLSRISICSLAIILAGCGGAKSYKLSEMNEPDKAKQLLEELSPSERTLLTNYVIAHSMTGDIDYKTTVGDAIAAQEQANKTKQEQQQKLQNAANAIK